MEKVSEMGKELKSSTPPSKTEKSKNRKSWKFLRWPVGIVAGALLIYFGAPWVWRNANPIFEAFLAFGGPSKVEPVKRTSEVCIAYAKIEVGVNGSDVVRLPNDVDFKVEPLGDHSYAIEYTTVSGVVGILEMPKTNHEPKWLPERISSFKLISRESGSIEMGIRFYEILQNGKNVKTACPTIEPESKPPEENSKPLRTAGASFFSILPIYVLRRTNTKCPQDQSDKPVSTKHNEHPYKAVDNLFFARLTLTALSCLRDKLKDSVKEDKESYRKDKNNKRI